MLLWPLLLRVLCCFRLVVGAFCAVDGAVYPPRLIADRRSGTAHPWPVLSSASLRTSPSPGKTGAQCICKQHAIFFWPYTSFHQIPRPGGAIFELQEADGHTGCPKARLCVLRMTFQTMSQQPRALYSGGGGVSIFVFLPVFRYIVALALFLSESRPATHAR